VHSLFPDQASNSEVARWLGDRPLNVVPTGPRLTRYTSSCKRHGHSALCRVAGPGAPERSKHVRSVAIAAAQRLTTSLTARHHGAGLRYKTYKANLKGSVLVLDVSSLVNGGPHAAGACQASCSRLLGCSGFTLCTLEAGCGNGCRDYVRTHPERTPRPAPPQTHCSAAPRTSPPAHVLDKPCQWWSITTRHGHCTPKLAHSSAEVDAKLPAAPTPR
jgi:hypothetical protein